MKSIRQLIEASPLQPLVVRLKNRVPDSPDSLIFVQIGKCGGRTVWDAIRESPVVREKFSAVSRVHVRPIHAKSRYIIVVRNPIARALSAFNWRYRIVVEDAAERDRFDGEYDALLKYGTLNTLAEALYADGEPVETAAAECRSIHHLKEDIAYYLADLLAHLSDGQLFAVLATEFLDDDIARVLGIRNTGNTHENRSKTDADKLVLSDRARENLRRFFRADYAALETLATLGALSEEKYRVLTE